MQLQPKPLILKLLLAADGQQLSARDAISAGALFDIAENHIRVALTRLTAEGLIEATARGQYQLTPRAWTLAGEIRGWWGIGGTVTALERPMAGRALCRSWPQRS